MSELSKLLKSKRIEKKYSQNRLGKKLGYSSDGQLISNFERGKQYIPLRELPEISRILEIPLRDIEDAVMYDYRDKVRRIFHDAIRVEKETVGSQTNQGSN